MKRILLTITLVLTSLIGFGQLNLNFYNAFNSIDELNNKVIEANPSVHGFTLYDGITYIDYRLTKEYRYLVYTDKDNKFLDLVVIERTAKDNEPFLRYSISDLRFAYEKDIEITTNELENDSMVHKIMFSNNTHVIIIMHGGSINVRQYKDDKLINWW